MLRKEGKTYREIAEKLDCTHRQFAAASMMPKRGCVNEQYHAEQRTE